MKRTIAVAGLVLLAAACRGSTTPVEAYRAFAAAVRAGDSAAAWEMISSRSREVLDARARDLASRAPPGVVPRSGKELLLGDRAAASPRLTSVVVVRESRDAAVLAVQVEGAPAAREVSLVRERGVWRVVVPFDN